MITLLIPSWKEQLEEKLRNLAAVTLPAGQLQVIIISDKLTDLPTQLSGRGIEIKIIRETERKGKAAAINTAMQLVNTPLVIFHDANTSLHPDSIVQLCAPFSDPSIGGVAGEKRVRTDHLNPSALEGYYWKYESNWKRMEARYFSVIGGAGELFAIRTELFEPLPEDCLLDDLELSWQVIRKGFRIAYAPRAISTEFPSRNLKEESRRRIRIATGTYQFLDRHSLRSIFRVSFRYGIQFFFRKWLRWVAWPLLTLILPLLWIYLQVYHSDGRGTAVFTGVLVGYGVVCGVGGLLSLLPVRAGWLGMPFYFLFIQYCQICGWFRYRLGNPSVLWEKSDRSHYAIR